MKLHPKFKKLQCCTRKKYHPLQHLLHHKHQISRRTLFYMKEYGPHTHIARTIIRESIMILLLAAIISSLGGLAIESIRTILVTVVPLLILIPALNNMVGEYGIIISSKVSTMLYEGKMKGKWWINYELKRLFLQLLVAVVLTASISTILAFIIAGMTTTAPAFSFGKVLGIVLLDVLVLVTVLMVLGIKVGRWVYARGEDPSNILIPLTTSIADLGNLLIFSGLIALLL